MRTVDRNFTNPRINENLPALCRNCCIYNVPPGAILCDRCEASRKPSKEDKKIRLYRALHWAGIAIAAGSVIAFGVFMSKR